MQRCCRKACWRLPWAALGQEGFGAQTPQWVCCCYLPSPDAVYLRRGEIVVGVQGCVHLHALRPPCA